MILPTYPKEQRDLRWVTITLITITTLLLLYRLSATVKNRGCLGPGLVFVIMANVRVVLPIRAHTENLGISHSIFVYGVQSHDLWLWDAHR